MSSASRSLHIVHVAPGYHHPPVGGGEVLVKALSERLAARGHRVTVVCLKSIGLNASVPDPKLPARETINGVDVHRLPVAATFLVALNRVLRVRGAWRVLSTILTRDRVSALASNPVAPRAFPRILQLAPDIVTLVNWSFAAFLYPFALAKRFRAFSLVGLPLLHTDAGWAHSSVIDDLLRRSDALLLNTDHEQRFVEARGYPACRAYVVGAGVDPADFPPGRGAEFRLRHGIGDAPLIGFVGRFQRSKGVIVLIQAMRRVWASYPEARLLLAGYRFPPPSDEAVALDAALAALPERGRQRVLLLDGFADADKAALFDAADLFAMPSVAESFGITYLEAWACKKPVIGARIGAVQCLIEDGVDGILVPPNDPDRMAAAIASLLGDAARRERMGSAGHEKTLSRYTWDAITDRVEQVYLDLAHRARQQGEPR